MLNQMFELAVVISAVDHFTAPAKQMAAQMGLLSKQTEAVRQKMANFKALAMTGGAITGFGGLIAKGLIDAAESAGKLQTSMMGVKESLGLTNAEYQKMMNMSQTIGIPTIFSAEQVGGIAQAMATAGLLKQQVLDPNILRQYVNFADVQAQIKKENPDDVVSTGINMAHQYQLYSTAQINPFLNQLNAALLHTHDSASEFGTTYKYIANQAKSMGMDSSDTLAATAWLGRMGFGSGKGGTNFADFLQRSIYHSSGDKADAAMEKAGFVQDGHSVFTDQNGKFVGVPEAVKIMQDFGKRFHGNANLMDPLLHDIFGTQGARVAMMMTSSGASGQYTNVQKQIAGTSSINQTQEDLNNTWAGKVKQLQSTIQDIGQAFGQSVLPYLKPVVSVLDDLLGKVLEFEQNHPKIMAFISGFAALAAAVALVIGPIMTLTGVFGYMSQMGLFRIGFQILSRSVIGMLGPLAIFAGIAMLIYENWGTLEPYFERIAHEALPKIKVAFADIEHAGVEAAKFIHDNWSYIQPFVEGIVGAWLAFVIIMGVVRGAIAVATLVQWAWNAAMNANPIGLIVTGIGLLVGAIIWCVQNWEIVRAKAVQVWEVFKNNPILWFVGGPITILIGAIAGIIANWDLLKEGFVNGWATIRNAFISGVDAIIPYVNKLIDAWNYVTGSNVSHLSGIGGVVMTDAKASTQQLTNNQAMRSFHMVNGSHANGLNYVPFDGYIAQLHKGEMVLTAQQANLYRQASSQLSGAKVSNVLRSVGGGGNTTVSVGDVHIYGADRQADDIVDEMFGRLGVQARRNNMSRPMGPNRLVFKR